jgi:hypothetical protein
VTSTTSSPGTEQAIINLLLSTSIESRNKENENNDNSIPIGTKMTDLYSSIPTPSTTHGDNDGGIHRGELWATLEILLLAGKREEAVALAVNRQEWAMAMLIATNCGADTYKEVSKAFAASTFPPSSPLHLAALLFSNQASSALLYGDKRLGISQADKKKEVTIITLWRRNLAMIIANKSPDWRALIGALGDRLKESNQNIYGAHIAYMCSGILPFANINNDNYGGIKTTITIKNEISTYGLLGVGTGVLPPSHLLNLTALRLTEIFEWTLNKQDSGNTATGMNASTSFTSLGGLFGMGSTPKDPQPNPIVAIGEGLVGVPRDTVNILHMRHALCPYMIQHALLLADLGLSASAIAYASEVKQLILGASSSSKPQPQQRGKKPSPVPPESHGAQFAFSKKMIFILDEFIDRLQKSSTEGMYTYMFICISVGVCILFMYIYTYMNIHT